MSKKNLFCIAAGASAIGIIVAVIIHGVAKAKREKELKDLDDALEFLNEDELDEFKDFEFGESTEEY